MRNYLTAKIIVNCSPTKNPLSFSSSRLSLFLQAHPTSALESFTPQPNSFSNYPAGPGNPFPLQPGLHPQLGWQ